MIVIRRCDDKPYKDLLKGPLGPRILKLHLDNKKVAVKDLYKGQIGFATSMNAILFKEILHSRKNRVQTLFLALDGEKPVGIGLCFNYYKRSTLSVYVLPKYRRQGIGASLVKNLLEIKPSAVYYSHDSRSAKFYTTTTKKEEAP